MANAVREGAKEGLSRKLEMDGGGGVIDEFLESDVWLEDHLVMRNLETRSPSLVSDGDEARVPEEGLRQLL